MTDIIQRIPGPVVGRFETGTRFVQPPVIEGLRPPVIDFPTVTIPSYEPPVLVPSPVIPTPGPIRSPASGTEEEQEEEKENEKEEETTTIILPDPTVGRPVVEVPFVGTIPLPTTSEVGLAGTTAVAATAAALIGKSLVETLVKRFKPLVKKIMLKLKERGKNRFTDYELQLYFELEGKVPEQKSAAKLLKKEFGDSKRSQLEAHLQRQHQSKPRRKASPGGNKSHFVSPRHIEEA